MESNPTQAVTAMLLSILASIAENNTAIDVTLSNDNSTHFKIWPHPDDVGKLIGKSGRIARSLRIILGAASARYKTRFTFEIVETSNFEKSREREKDATANA